MVTCERLVHLAISRFIMILWDRVKLLRKLGRTFEEPPLKKQIIVYLAVLKYTISTFLLVDAALESV